MPIFVSEAFPEALPVSANLLVSSGSVPMLTDFIQKALGFLEIAGFKIKISQVVDDDGIVLNDLIGLKKIFLGIFQVVQFEVSPPERIEIGSVSWIDGQSFLDVPNGFVEPDPPVRQHIAEVVQTLSALDGFSFRISLKRDSARS